MSCPTEVGTTLVSSGSPLILASSLPVSAPCYRVEEAVSAAFTRAMVHSYQRWLGVAHPAVGAACATQHYAGRVASWLAGCWVSTGGLPPLDGCLAEIDCHGRTLNLVVPDSVEVSPAGPLDVVAALQGHLAPMLETACEVGRITTRLAWGGVATGLAGVLLRSLAPLDQQRRAAVLADAEAMLAPDAWPVPRPLVSLIGERQQRHTCCLIRLSAEHERCTTCPHHVPAR